MHATTEARRELSDPADALRRIDDVLRLSKSAIWEIDRDGVFTYVSPSFEDLLGYCPEELVGVRTIHDFYPPDLTPELERECAPDWLNEAREFTKSEVPLLAKSGQVVWVASDGKPIFDKDGNFAGYRGADTDITQRKLMEDRLLRRESQLMDLIASAPVAIAYTPLGASSEMHVNKVFEQLFGYSAEEVPTMDDWFCRAYPDPAYREEVQRRSAELLAAIAAGRPAPGSQDYRVRHKDGRIIDVEIGAAIVGGCFVGTFVDVTARQRKLDQARAEHSELRAMLDNLPFPVAMSAAGHDFDWTDARAELSYINDSFTALFGYELVDIPKAADFARKAIPDEARRASLMAAMEAQVQRALAGLPEASPLEVRMSAKDGRELEVLFKAVAVAGGVVVSFQDLTERNRAERLLREQRDQLAHVGRVSALGQLAASLAHELDQPLGAILNNAETARILLAEKKPSISELGAILNDIVEDDRRAGEVLDRIRAMVQKQSFRPSAVDVSQLLRDVVNLVQAAAAKKKIRLETSCEPGLSLVEGDRVLLQQALLNLVLNSIDAIGNRAEGAISLRAGEAGTHRVGISVSDNGGGVSPEEAEQLLQPFHTTKEGGLGMGLPIVNSIVEQHGGSLRVDNQPGRGLSVALVLPCWEDKTGG